MNLNQRIEQAKKQNDYEELRSLFNLEEQMENLGKVLSFEKEVDPFTNLVTVKFIVDEDE